jgi:hypothetical protein
MDHDVTLSVASSASDGIADFGSVFLEIDHFDQWSVSTDALTFSRMCATRIDEAVAI